MRIIALIAPATWPAVIAAVQRHRDATVHLIATAEPPAPLLGPPGGLMGRGRPPVPPSPGLAESAASELLAQATDTLGRSATHEVLHGPAERAVVHACADADLLVLARDGDNTRLGPASLEHQTRFIVDHAPCTVELVWPSAPPSVATIPPGGPRPPA